MNKQELEEAEELLAGVWIAIGDLIKRSCVEAAKELISMHFPVWHCGCGHTNGCNLAVCAQCGRKPGEVSDD